MWKNCGGGTFQSGNFVSISWKSMCRCVQFALYKGISDSQNMHFDQIEVRLQLERWALVRFTQLQFVHSFQFAAWFTCFRIIGFICWIWDFIVCIIQFSFMKLKNNDAIFGNCIAKVTFQFYVCQNRLRQTVERQTSHFPHWTRVILHATTC